jgi:DNA-binding CsgD family transcriptional regulator
MGKGRRSDGTCRACVLAAAAARRQRILALTAEGRSSRQIAGEFDTTPEVIRVTRWRARHRSVNTIARLGTLEQ